MEITGRLRNSRTRRRGRERPNEERSVRLSEKEQKYFEKGLKKASQINGG